MKKGGRRDVRYKPKTHTNARSLVASTRPASPSSRQSLRQTVGADHSRRISHRPDAEWWRLRPFLGGGELKRRASERAGGMSRRPVARRSPPRGLSRRGPPGPRALLSLHTHTQGSLLQPHHIVLVVHSLPLDSSTATLHAQNKVGGRKRAASLSNRRSGKRAPLPLAFPLLSLSPSRRHHGQHSARSSSTARPPPQLRARAPLVRAERREVSSICVGRRRPRSLALALARSLVPPPLKAKKKCGRGGERRRRQPQPWCRSCS
jgi:hypothetical protein